MRVNLTMPTPPSGQFHAPRLRPHAMLYISSETDGHERFHTICCRCGWKRETSCGRRDAIRQYQLHLAEELGRPKEIPDDGYSRRDVAILGGDPSL